MRLLEKLRTLYIETNRVITKPGEMTLAFDVSNAIGDVGPRSRRVRSAFWA